MFHSSFLFIESLNDICDEIDLDAFSGIDMTLTAIKTNEIPPLEMALEALMDCPQHAELLEMLTSLKTDIELYSSNALQQNCFVVEFDTRYCPQ